MTKFLPLLMFIAAACSKSEKPAAAPPTNPTAPGPSMAATPNDPPAKPEQPPPPPPPGDPPPAAPVKEMQALSTYLAPAVAATFFTRDTDLAMKETKKLDEKATKAYLSKLDLTQTGTGGLVKCPNDSELKLFDAAAKLVGTIGFCQNNARFDAPDGAFGGINAQRP